MSADGLQKVRIGMFLQMSADKMHMSFKHVFYLMFVPEKDYSHRHSHIYSTIDLQLMTSANPSKLSAYDYRHIRRVLVFF